MADARLSILAFPQRWNGAELGLRVLVLPKGSPREPLLPGAPPFAEAELALDAVLVAGLEQLPAPGVETARQALDVELPEERAELFAELERVFNIKPPAPGTVIRPPGTRVLKFLTQSYRSAFAFDGPRTEFALTDDRYKCALTETNVADRPPRPPLTDEVTWGRVLAFAVKNPLLAEKLGLLFADLTLSPGGAFETGGFVYVTLAAGSAYAAEVGGDPTLLGVYAARIPPLTEPRQVFAAVGFPVLAAPPGEYNDLFVEAESYDDGFAKIVHGAQPRTMGVADLDPSDPLPVKDVGIRLGWDDEQVAIWLNRRISPETAEDTVLGVGTYRVDVRLAGAQTWHSLVRVRGPVQVGEVPVGLFQGELGVQTAPVQLLGEKTGDLWLPSFFTSWAGRSVAVRDRDAFRVAGQDAIAADRSLEPVDDDAVPLRYGEEYEFRVRLRDLSGGGPEVAESALNPAPAPVGRVPFRRFVPPGLPIVTTALGKLLVERPRLGFPDLVFTGFDDAVDRLLGDTPVAVQEGRQPGVHDPDVTAVQVAVEVRLPEGDDRAVPGREPYLRLFTALRDFVPGAQLADRLEIPVAFEDVKDIATLRAVDPERPELGVGPITLPTARELRLLVRAVGRPDPGLAYFGSEEARVSQLDVRVDVRASSKDERTLFVPQAEGEQIQAIFMQPEPAPTSQLAAQLALEGRRSEAPADIAQRLARQIELDVSGLTFSGRPGRRTVFGCSSALAHTLAPARSSVTFGSKADLTRQWIVAVRVRLDRDWTWEGVDPRGFEILRDAGEVAGTIDLPRSVDAAALAGPDRSTTDLVFFDAVDGKPPAGSHPGEVVRRYYVRPVFRRAPALADEPLEWSLRLPITTPPRQTPRLLAAGLALSPYETDDDYGSTEPRTRMLWLEVEAPPDDPADQYFARVLAYAPDPLLLDSHEDVPIPEEPPLAVDPEPIRVIGPGQPGDRSGLDAMQPLIPATPREPGEPVRHYLVPLPPGVDAASPRLFGFFVYELRLGHDASRWSTAQGRFGPPLRISGVQHPAPPLTCAVTRLPHVVAVSAPLATPVLHGRNLRPNRPRTEIWALLYAQVTQLDGGSQRNLLVARARAEPEVANTDQRYGDRRLELASTSFDENTVTGLLGALGLPLDSPLSVIAVEVYRGALASGDPLGVDLGQVRVLRASPLTRVPRMCLPA